MSFALQQLEAYKAVALLVISDELAKSAAPGANDLFANELRKAVAVANDTRFLQVISESTGIASNPSSGLTTTPSWPTWPQRSMRSKSVPGRSYI